MWRKQATLRAARAVLDSSVPSQGWAHELGHGILGMCHIDGFLIGGPGNSLMSGGPGVHSGALPHGLSPYDIAATRAVYAAGLEPGRGRAAFVQAGLLRP
jgi:hypothetical protein